MNVRYPEVVNVAEGIGPADNGGQALDGNWAHLAGYSQLAVVFSKGAGAANQDPTLSIEQATDAAGSNAKPLEFDRVWVKQGADLAAVEGWTLVELDPPQSSYTDPDSGEVAAIWVVVFNAEELDLVGGFTHVRARLSDPGAAEQLVSVAYHMTGARFAGTDRLAAAH